MSQVVVKTRGAGGSHTPTSWCIQRSWLCRGAGLIWRRARLLSWTASSPRFVLPRSAVRLTASLSATPSAVIQSAHLAM